MTMAFRCWTRYDGHVCSIVSGNHTPKWFQVWGPLVCLRSSVTRLQEYDKGPSSYLSTGRPTPTRPSDHVRPQCAVGLVDHEGETSRP